MLVTLPTAESPGQMLGVIEHRLFGESLFKGSYDQGIGCY